VLRETGTGQRQRVGKKWFGGGKWCSQERTAQWRDGELSKGVKMTVAEP
jgi:hypothetical protein